ncbi:hypothetical protein JCM5353_005366 [Sporobolomyces roseus]
MAGGLFAVYRDTTALPPSHSTSRRTGTSINPGANIKKKDGLSVFRDNTPSSNGQLEKENLDPLNKGGKKVLSGGKGKKPVMSGKSDCGSGGNAVKPVAMGDRMVKKVQQPTTRPPTNGVCTGTLRTRTLPPLPPLESEEVQIPLAPTAPLPPPVTEISRPKSPAPRNNLPRSAESPASNVDSGYGRVSDLDRGFDDESDLSLEVESVEGDDAREGNRRARALTESPLAEITQAFTGLGRFSNNNNNNNFDNTPASPSPSQYISQRPKLPRTRSSPSKSVSALPPRLQPYSSLNATTKKLKPGQLAATAPKAAPSRSLRF